MTRLAASQYAIELIETWEAYTAHLSAVVREAKSEGTLFPHMRHQGRIHAAAEGLRGGPRREHRRAPGTSYAVREVAGRGEGSGGNAVRVRSVDCRDNAKNPRSEMRARL